MGIPGTDLSVRDVLDAFIEAYNSADWARADELVAPDYVHHNNDDSLTWSQFKAGAAWLRRGFPDFRLVPLDVVAEGDRVALRLEGRGTHAGSLFGEIATGRPVVVHINYLCRVADGRLAEDWEVMDEMDLRRKIGSPIDAR